MNLQLDTLFPTKIDPLSRFAGGEYATLFNVFSVIRPN